MSSWWNNLVSSAAEAESEEDSGGFLSSIGDFFSSDLGRFVGGVGGSLALKEFGLMDSKTPVVG